MHRAVLFLVATVAAAAPAGAHWQYSRWGMTPEEVRAANPQLTAGVDEYNSFNGSLVKVSGTYSEGGREYLVRFGFNAQNRLNTVFLEPRNRPECRRIIRDMERRFGRGERGSNIPDLIDVRTWQDRAGGNMVQSYMIGRAASPGSCQFRYHPPEGPGDPPPPPGKPGSDI